jgi:hypothetical protein
MAQRPIFIPASSGAALVQTEMVEFQWHPGMSVSQKQRSIASLHEAASNLLGLHRVLEVSSKSSQRVGVLLSAFNLPIEVGPAQCQTRVECAFQASKVFSEGGPHDDILRMDARDAKRDPRLKSSGNLVGFRFEGDNWPLEPQTAFYDWIYMRALRNQPHLANQLEMFDAFTDIEFNPGKSINCQAYSAALFVSLSRRKQIDRALSSRAAFLEVLEDYATNNARQNDQLQGRLF